MVPGHLLVRVLRIKEQRRFKLSFYFNILLTGSGSLRRIKKVVRSI
jgi:hypothetical protein